MACFGKLWELSGGIHRFNLRHPYYRTSLNLITKVLDFVKSGGPISF